MSKNPKHERPDKSSSVSDKDYDMQVPLTALGRMLVNGDQEVVAYLSSFDHGAVRAGHKESHMCLLTFHFAYPTSKGYRPDFAKFISDYDDRYGRSLTQAAIDHGFLKGVPSSKLHELNWASPRRNGNA